MEARVGQGLDGSANLNYNPRALKIKGGVCVFLDQSSHPLPPPAPDDLPSSLSSTGLMREQVRDEGDSPRSPPESSLCSPVTTLDFT